MGVYVVVFVVVLYAQNDEQVPNMPCLEHKYNRTDEITFIPTTITTDLPANGTHGMLPLSLPSNAKIRPKQYSPQMRNSCFVNEAFGDSQRRWCSKS